MTDDNGRWVIGCGGNGCGANIYQRNLRYRADRDTVCIHCQRVLDGNDDMLGVPSVAQEAEWCGCGDHDAVDHMMLAYLRSRAEPLWPKRELEGVSDDAALLLAYISDELGWTEHGTSIRGAWLTDDGKKALANLESLVAASSDA